jgi:signal transduction histidine kinase/ActR/RegA family two-component response regulator
MSVKEAQLEQRVAELSAEAQDLDDQLRTLVKTEHRLTKAQFQLDIQLQRVRALSAFSLASSSAEDTETIVSRAIALIQSVFSVDRVGVVARGNSGEVVRGDGIAPFALTASMRRALDRETVPCVGTLIELPWARTLVANATPGASGTTNNDAETVAAFVPLTNEREVRGFVFWRRPSPRSSYLSEPPSQDDLPFLTLLAGHVVHALRNARLTEALRGRTDELAKTNLLLRQSLADVERAQEQLAQSSRLEAIGRLAGGVAHDFNNLLTVILANAELLREDMPNDPALHEELLPILDSAERASQITHQLLMFSRKDAVAYADISLNQVTGELLKMLRRLLGVEITLTTSFDPDVGLVHADRSQLEQVILNLGANARDAMPRGGLLTVETRSASPAEVARAGAVLPPSAYVALVVTDTGAGMTPETLAHVFDPFFTTKDRKRGTGLGLSIVHGVIEKAEGHILVDSQLGHGSRFVILLPRSDARRRPVPESSPSRSATILLVEDEDEIRAVARRVLVRHGFHVLEARNGEEGLQIARREGTVDLLLTDVVMPQISGVELADTLRREDRVRGVLFMSGYTFDTLEVHKLGENERFLQKPFTPRLLLQRVNECVASDTPAPPHVTH